MSEKMSKIDPEAGEKWKETKMPEDAIEKWKAKNNFGAPPSNLRQDQPQSFGGQSERSRGFRGHDENRGGDDNGRRRSIFP